MPTQSANIIPGKQQGPSIFTQLFGMGNGQHLARQNITKPVHNYFVLGNDPQMRVQVDRNQIMQESKACDMFTGCPTRQWNNQVQTQTQCTFDYDAKKHLDRESNSFGFFSKVSPPTQTRPHKFAPDFANEETGSNCEFGTEISKNIQGTEWGN